jgi:hypothetical protein
MTEKRNAPQEVVDDLITNPDEDAEGSPPPEPPQTIANEPDGQTSNRSDA